MKTEKKLMPTVNLNEEELDSLGWIALATAEPNDRMRERAILSAKYQILRTRLDKLNEEQPPMWRKDPENSDFDFQMTEISSELEISAVEFSQVFERFLATNEAKLATAIEIAKLVFQTIQQGKFRGLQSKSGILHEYSYEARKQGRRGEVDHDGLRETWNAYRGVVHLALAIELGEAQFLSGPEIIDLAEQIRVYLSQNCPRSTKKPYVDPRDQILFLYISDIWGPRFQGRGLSYSVV